MLGNSELAKKSSREKIRKLRLTHYRKKHALESTYSERRLRTGDNEGWCFSTDVRLTSLKHERRLEARRAVGGKRSTDPALRGYALKGYFQFAGCCVLLSLGVQALTWNGFGFPVFLPPRNAATAKEGKHAAGSRRKAHLFSHSSATKARDSEKATHHSRIKERDSTVEDKNETVSFHAIFTDANK